MARFPPCLACFCCLWIGRVVPGDGRSDDPPSKAATLRFDEDDRRFLLENPGESPIWTAGFVPGYPFRSVERKTPDGWVATHVEACTAGARRIRIEPGGSLRFACPLGPDRALCRFLGYDTRYPDLDRLPVRVSVGVSSGEASTRSDEVRTRALDAQVR